MPKYRVVEQKTKTFMVGRITAGDIEALLNTHAKEGWTLDRIIAGETARFMGMGEKDVFLLIFKRD